MSNEREIRLVGSFKDEITPKLQQLNKSINDTIRTFSRFSRTLRPLAKEMGTVAYAGKSLEATLTSQRNSFQAASRSMVAYRRELRRTASLQKMVASGRLLPQEFISGPRLNQRAGGGVMPRSASIRPTFAQRRAAAGAAQIPAPIQPNIPRQFSTAPTRVQQSLAQGAQFAPPPMPAVSAARPPIIPQQATSVGRTTAALAPQPTIADGAAGAAFGVTLGSQIGSVMTNAIMTGFSKGVELMQKPFRFLAHEFRHAMQEEMADITAAGAMFALDLSAGTKMFEDFEDARMAQEILDQRLAQSASRLPGQTLMYVQQARQLQDTVMQALGKDQEAFMKAAEGRGAVAGDMRDAFATILAEFTERAVLVGLGSGDGSRGLGTPQLLERMVTQESVNISSMANMFGALRGNPLLRAALERNEAAINATTVGTIERIQAIQKALDEALPQEVITAMTMTMEGIAEGFKSSIFDIAAGWFGIRRMMTGVKAETFKMNGEIKVATDSTLSLFDILRDTIGFFVVPLLELTSILPDIYEPFEGLVNSLIPLRRIGARFTYSFNRFAKGYEELAKELFPDDLDTQTKFLKTRGPRAALLSIAKLLEEFDPTFSSDAVATELMKLEPNLGGVAKDLITSLLESDFAAMVGETIGRFIGEALGVMADLLTGTAEFATGGKFAKGLSDGLSDSKAFDAIREIFRKVFEVMGKAIFTIVTELPVETLIYVGITALLPAALAALGTKIGLGLSAVLGKAGKTIQSFLTGSARGAIGVQGPMATTAGTAGLRAAGVGKQAVRQNTAALGQIGAAIPGVAKGAGAARGFLGAAAKGGKMKGVGLAAAGIVKLSTMGPQIAKLGKFATNFGRNIPYLNIAFAGLDFAARKAEGEDTVTAAAGAGGGLVGGVIGGAIGTAILPGVGTAIGGILGTMLGSWVGEKLPGMIQAIPALWDSAVSFVTEALSTIWNSLTNFFTQTIPSLWNSAVSFVTDALSAAWNGLVNFIKSIPGLILTGLKTLEKFFVEDVPFAISFAIGYAIQILENVWDSLVHFFTVTIPTAWAAGLNFVKNVLNTVWAGLVEFFTVTIPTAWTNTITFVQNVISNAWEAIVAFFYALPGMMASAWESLVKWARSLPETIGKAFTNFISYVATVPEKITDALSRVGSAIVEWARGLPGRVIGALGQGFQAGREAAKNEPPASAQFNGSKRLMPLSQAIATELRHKPPGSNLVIANSSETIIPGNMMGSAWMQSSPALIPTSSNVGSAKNITTGPITINVDGYDKDPRELTEIIATQLVSAMYRKASSEVLTS